PHAARRPRTLCRRREGPRPYAVRDAVAHEPDCRQGDGAFTIRHRAESQSTERHREHRLDQADEVRRHLVGDAHRDDDVELGTETWSDHRDYETLHRFGPSE